MTRHPPIEQERAARALSLAPPLLRTTDPGFFEAATPHGVMPPIDRSGRVGCAAVQDEGPDGRFFVSEGAGVVTSWAIEVELSKKVMTHGPDKLVTDSILFPHLHFI